MDLLLTKQEAEKLVEKCTTGIDYLLNRLKYKTIISEKDYEILGALDDLIIEYEDLRASYLRLRNIYSKLYTNKGGI